MRARAPAYDQILMPLVSMCVIREGFGMEC